MNLKHLPHWCLAKKCQTLRKRVGIIGTGSSGVQSIPIISETAQQLLVFQRTPNFSLPARHRDLPDDRRDEYKKTIKNRDLAKNSSLE